VKLGPGLSFSWKRALGVTNSKASSVEKDGYSVVAWWAANETR